MDRAGAWAGEPVMPAFQTMWPRWRLVQAVAARRGLLSFGPNRGRAVTYAAPPAFEAVEPEGAVAELLDRYLRAYGPSTPAAYAKWHAAPIGWANRTFEALADRGRIAQVDFDGIPAWLARDDVDFSVDPPPGVLLLPYFDGLAIAAYPRERFFPGRASERALAGGQAGNFPVVLLDGEVAGVAPAQGRATGADHRRDARPAAPLTPCRTGVRSGAARGAAGPATGPRPRRGDDWPARLTASDGVSSTRSPRGP